MMTSEWEQIEEALGDLRQVDDAQFVQDVASIVRQNASRGRLRKFLESETVASVHEYVQLVAAHYRRQAGAVAAVKQSDDPEIWEPFYILLQKWAYGALTKRDHLYPAERQDHAEACAADAAVVIRTQNFPFDAEFEAWAYNVVVYVCASHVRKARGGPSVPDHAQVSLEQSTGATRSVVDPQADIRRRRFDQRYDLMQHIRALSGAQQQFVMLHYLEEKGYDEIAALMGRSKNALYKLNFDALANLRKKMVLSEHKYE